MSLVHVRLRHLIFCLLLPGAFLGAQVRAQETGPETGPEAGPATVPAAPEIPVAPAAVASATTEAASELARSVVIYRDAYGTPHIDGPTDESVVFGFAYAQAEDFFWQVEDTYILALGRYAEVHGASGVNSDLLNRVFEIVPRARADFAGLEPGMQSLCSAFVSGLNYYLDTNPGVRTRLISRFEPWHVLAYGRHLSLELTFRYTRLSNNYLPRANPQIAAAVGSNAWAIAPRRTRSGNAMLFANPHQPWFGFGQLYEAHLRSGEGWNFSGATFFGCPLPMIGHNDDLGWSCTTNEPDIADVWRVTFDDPQQPLAYRYDGGYRTATQWRETIKVQTGKGLKNRVYTFRKTHHGPIVGKDDDAHQLAANIAGLHESLLIKQLDRLVRARNLGDFKAGMALLQMPFMNTVYADREGNILFQYNGLIPRRQPGFDYSRPLDGSDPRTQWRGFHTIDELPHVLNPPDGYVQNCNSSPFTTTESTNPPRDRFPHYMVEDKDDDKRRAKISRELLGEMYNLSFEDLERAAFDTTNWWARHELPVYGRELEALRAANPELAARAAPYLEHLLEWDARTTRDSTQATLCLAWYEELYGTGYPGESLKEQFIDDWPARFVALVQAAERLKAIHGDWKVPWGKIHRIQRHADVADLIRVPFSDSVESLPCLGSHGPMGVVFTQYYTPTIRIPLLKTINRRYGVVGYTYTGVFEFGDRVKGATLLNFGASGDPTSPHFFDQAAMLSDCRLKPELFHWDDVLAGAREAYHPGERATGAPVGGTLARPGAAVKPTLK